MKFPGGVPDGPCCAQPLLVVTAGRSTASSRSFHQRECRQAQTPADVDRDDRFREQMVAPSVAPQ